MRKLFIPTTIYLAVVIIFATGIGWWGYQKALNSLAKRGQTELSLAVDGLQGHIQKFRQLSVVMADHPALIDLVTDGGTGIRAKTESLLLETADKTGSQEIFVLSADGRLLASSNPSERTTDYSETSYFQRALNGALGTAQGHTAEEGRSVYSAAPIRLNDRLVGALVVRADIEAVETDWRSNPNDLYFVDKFGVVFGANRRRLLFLKEFPSTTDRELAAISKKYPDISIAEFPTYRSAEVAGNVLWSFRKDPHFKNPALRLTKSTPVIGLEARILIDTAPVLRTALLQAAFAAAASLVVGGVLLILTQRRIALAERLEVEEYANLELESRVARRTAELSRVNEDLRQQVKERQEAEDALKEAQQELVQAGKLSALGQMSAGISHELNQPLMAIRSFAENATQFLDQGNTTTTRQNLTRISDLARRMGRIIKNLRAFSRREGEPMTDVDLSSVVEAALELIEPRLAETHVNIHRPDLKETVMVRGGEVRLQQVVLNLLSNAIDAMEAQSEKEIWISIEQGDAQTNLSIRDNGPGLGDPKKIFDPFYSTKAVGKSEGMGLGLSISYGIVQSFGGRITGKNHADGGAVFTVNLTPVGLEDAA